MLMSDSPLSRTQVFADIHAKAPVLGPWADFCRRAIGADKDVSASVLEHAYADGSEVFLYVSNTLSFAGIRTAHEQELRFDILSREPGHAEKILHTLRGSIGAHTANHRRVERGTLPQREGRRLNDRARSPLPMVMVDAALSKPMSPDSLIRQSDYTLEGHILIRALVERNEHQKVIHPHRDGGLTTLSVFREGQKGGFGFFEAFAAADGQHLSHSFVIPGLQDTQELVTDFLHVSAASRSHTILIGRDSAPAAAKDFILATRRRNASVGMDPRSIHIPI